MAKFHKLTETERHLRNLLGMSNETKESVYLEIGEQPPQKAKMKIFCVDLTHFSKMTQFLVLSAATFFFYLIYGYLQVRHNKEYFTVLLLLKRKYYHF